MPVPSTYSIYLYIVPVLLTGPYRNYYRGATTAVYQVPGSVHDFT